MFASLHTYHWLCLTVNTNLNANLSPLKVIGWYTVAVELEWSCLPASCNDFSVPLSSLRPSLRHLFLWVMGACWDTNLCLSVCMSVRSSVCSGSCVIRMSLGVPMHMAWAVKDFGIRHLIGSNAWVLPNRNTASLIRDSNDDGGSIQSKGKRRNSILQLGNRYVSCLESDLVNIQDVLIHHKKRSTSAHAGTSCTHTLSATLQD